MADSDEQHEDVFSSWDSQLELESLVPISVVSVLLQQEFFFVVTGTIGISFLEKNDGCCITSSFASSWEDSLQNEV